jgi:hypothetical protein
MLQRVSPFLHSFLFIILIGTCSSIVYYINREPGVTPPPTVTPSALPALVGTSGAVPDTGWSLIQPGLERRVIQVYDDQHQPVESVHIWRLDQNHFRMDVAFEEVPKSLETWQKETNPAMVVNGGFFSIENERYFPNGLTVLDGVASGRSYNGYGGMLAIHEYGAELRWLVERPYEPGEAFQAALQSFPILVKPGGELGYPEERENHVGARRTVIAQDRDGRILFIVTPQGHFTLHQLSVYLTESDLNLEVAVNLDGGGSTGILVANPRELISPTRPIPFVILVYPR